MPDQSVKVSLELVGQTALESYFDHLSHVPDDWRGAWDPMAEDFRTAEAETFGEEGPGWAPLRPRYAKWKSKHYPGMPLLVRTGALELSLTDPFADGAINEINPTWMELGTDLKTTNKSGKQYTLGMLHQTGTRRGMPARPPIIIRPTLQKTWNRRLAQWLRDEIGYDGGDR